MERDVCDCSDAAEPAVATSRRTLLVGAAGAALTGLGAMVFDAQDAQAAGAYDPALLTATPRILPRSAWAGTSCPPRGALSAEKPGNVRCLLVHHTAQPGNGYTQGRVAELIRGIYRYHVSAAKKQPDVFYNFLVDKYGRIWEGRTGSLGRPVIPSATGGHQGFTQIACFIGNHSTVAPTPKAAASMVSLLAFLAARYGIDTRKGATTSFVSRGSNRHPRGTRVSTRTIEGHRRMSRTACPGDAAYTMVRNEFPTRVTRLLTP
jgi:uncharacterized protein with LGFP repeats